MLLLCTKQQHIKFFTRCLVGLLVACRVGGRLQGLVGFCPEWPTQVDKVVKFDVYTIIGSNLCDYHRLFISNIILLPPILPSNLHI